MRSGTVQIWQFRLFMFRDEGVEVGQLKASIVSGQQEDKKEDNQQETQVRKKADADEAEEAIPIWISKRDVGLDTTDTDAARFQQKQIEKIATYFLQYNIFYCLKLHPPCVDARK